VLLPMYKTLGYHLDNDSTVLWDVYDTANPTECKESGSFYIDCQ